MPFSIHDASIPVYIRRLEALSAILDKAAAYAESRKIDQATLLQARLFPDMLPFVRQVQMSCSHALRGAARLTGAEPLNLDDKPASFDDLKAMIAKTVAYLKSVDAGKMAGADDRDITFPAGDKTRTMKGGDYLAHFSMPNFYFHVTTAYAILRHNGLEIGKTDFMGA